MRYRMRRHLADLLPASSRPVAEAPVAGAVNLLRGFRPQADVAFDRDAAVPAEPAVADIAFGVPCDDVDLFVNALDETRDVQKPAEMTWRDFVVMLLGIASSIEHALMVQYLYAAYSLGRSDVAAKYRRKVKVWQDEILAVAREEMGHLLTVQNVLSLLGGPASLDRDDDPWRNPFYPFKFTLERLSIGSVACYAFAEMPHGWFDPTNAQHCDLIRTARAHLLKRDPESETPIAHRVGVLYHHIIDLLARPDRVPDDAFQGDSFAVQASWDDWGRGYKRRPDAPLPAEGAEDIATDVEPEPAPEANVIIERIANRDGAIKALQRIAEQGEARPIEPKHEGEHSHFDRFLRIFQQYRAILDEAGDAFKPSRDVPVDPVTRGPDDEPSASAIENPRSAQWAHLFNLRYRMLLTYLTHAFRLARQDTNLGEPGQRGAVMHRVFAEMYNLKTIAGILVRLPLGSEHAPTRAGPPFQMPYALILPLAAADRWRLHKDLIAASRDLGSALADQAHYAEEASYLKILEEADRRTEDWIDQVLAGLAVRRRHAE